MSLGQLAKEAPHAGMYIDTMTKSMTKWMMLHNSNAEALREINEGARRAETRNYNLTSRPALEERTASVDA